MRCLAPFLLLLPLPAVAQEMRAPSGTAFVQAPAQYSGAVVALSAAEAFEAAQMDGTMASALPEDCRLMAGCQPNGWAFDLSVQHGEGPHGHEVHGGLPDAASARTVAETRCDLGPGPDLIACSVVQLWDWDGTPQLARKLPAGPAKG